MDTNNLIVYLPFDESTTKDLCGNSWTATGNPAIEDTALKLDGSSYLEMDGGITLGGQDFTICGWFYLGTTGNWCRVFSLHNNANEGSTINFMRKEKGNTAACQHVSGGSTYFTFTLNVRHYLEINYSHANSTFKVFIDGELKVTDNVTIPRTFFANACIGKSNYTADDLYTGVIDEFMIYDGTALHTENFTPPTANDYPALKMALGEPAVLSLSLDTQRKIKNSQKPVARYISFTGASGSYGEIPLEVLAGASTFTVEFKISTASAAVSRSDYQSPTIFGQTSDKEIGLFLSSGKLAFWANPAGTRTITTNAVVNDGKIHKVAVVSSNGAINLYCDGALVAHQDNMNVQISASRTLYIAWNSYSNTALLQMDLYEARFWSIARTQEEIFADIEGDEDGLESWYIPDGSTFLKDCSINGRNAPLFGNPAYTFYQTLSLTLSFDLERRLKTKWRYVNAGDADDLIIASTILTDLPEEQSITGTAFYQTVRAKCFDIPATDDIWIKFDVFFNGSKRWRAYNEGSNGACGITVQTTLDLNFWGNGNDLASYNVCKKNQLQTVLLHMKSGSSNGIIEAWVDGEKIYTYTGDVNHGSDFEDIYLQSDGAGTFFSNVIISNTEISLADGYRNLSFDLQRKICNAVDFDLDVERNIIAPIFIPAIDNHFNHYIASLKVFRDKPLSFILPKESEVYFKAEGIGSVRVFSDSDSTGILTGDNVSAAGDMQAALQNCTELFLKVDSTVISPQQVIKLLMKYLVFKLPLVSKTQGFDALDAAIGYATYDKFQSAAAVTEIFLSDLNNSQSAADFLQTYCDIILDNSDTGAITGKDAGGVITKDAQAIVPEPVLVSDWQLPDEYRKIIRGVTVQFPIGLDGENLSELSDAQKHIIAGLNSVWLEQALILVEDSLGLNFTDSQWGGNIGPKFISVKFIDDDTNHTLAYIEPKYTGSYLSRFDLIINMHYYNDVDTASLDGTLNPSSDMYYSAGYLDRTLAHEITHAVMMANMRNFNALPLFIKEGSAEIVHGIDDLRQNNILDLITNRKADLQEIFSSGGSADSADAYSAGYLFLRYLAKQGQGNTFAPNEILLSDVQISDSSSFDSTRQIFFPDLSRALQKSFSISCDMELLNVILVDLHLDLKRALLAKLFLFPRDSQAFFAKKKLLTKNALRAESPQNTKGLQSFEISLAEQQITDQVSFTGIIPFDIMQQVTGQYLDYHFNMRVERVQQHGILYSCSCCSDIDQLLYTQMTYTIPPMTWYHKVDGETVAESTTLEIETHYPPASEHVKKIAHALGLSPVMQFDNFLSTVLNDDLGGVTYNDLIRDVFGWSARIPNKLINVFIRDNQLFVIQRGHESHSIDISDADKTIPIFTRELVRTFWGSSIWSKTDTTEFSLPYYVPSDKVVGTDDDDTVREVMTEFSGKDYQGYTTYTYDRKGLLVKTYTAISKGYPAQETYTTVNHSYDDDGTMIYTRSFTQSFGPEGNSASLSREQKGYVILPNGEKFLSWEKSETYQNDSGIDISDDNLVDSKVTTHSPSRVGQSHTVAVSTDGDIVGSVVGQNTGDDRVTPFRSKQARQLETGEWKNKTYESGQTIYGLGLYDSSFPIHDEASLIKVTKDLKELNRKTKETVSLTIYDFEHFIDFNDKVILDGNQYFLAANTARSTANIKFEQQLTLVRWY